MPYTRRAYAEPALANEVNQINTNPGNNEGLSNTFNKASQGLMRDTNNNNINPSNNNNTLINT
jgi:hypothetical protein